MRIGQLTKLVLINICTALLLLFLVEGMVSYFTIGHAFFTQTVAERQHTEYDEELGWINLPNVHIPDMYSREDPLTTNSQRYRSTKDFSVSVPAGMTRIICVGDSFTLGFGVDDDHTWCQQLTTLDERLETVNMGQGGYGVDQAFLWYRRDEQKLEHDMVLFAFIRDDFLRMKSDTFQGYGRPFLSVRDGELVQDNYPVPRRAYDASWLSANLHMWSELDTVQWLSGILPGLLPGRDTGQGKVGHDHTDQVVAKIFESLQEIGARNGRRTILVYLPTRFDVQEQSINRWERMVRGLAEAQGYELINVADEMRTLSPGEAEKMFRGGGHYTDEGNRFTAEVIARYIAELPELSASTASE